MGEKLEGLGGEGLTEVKQGAGGGESLTRSLVPRLRLIPANDAGLLPSLPGSSDPELLSHHSIDPHPISRIPCFKRNFREFSRELGYLI